MNLSCDFDALSKRQRDCTHKLSGDRLEVYSFKDTIDHIKVNSGKGQVLCKSLTFSCPCLAASTIDLSNSFESQSRIEFSTSRSISPRLPLITETK